MNDVLPTLQDYPHDKIMSEDFLYIKYNGIMNSNNKDGDGDDDNNAPSPVPDMDDESVPQFKLHCDSLDQDNCKIDVDDIDNKCTLYGGGSCPSSSDDETNSKNDDDGSSD